MDFIKLVDKQNGLYGVVNLNYMFPVKEEQIIDVKYGDIEQFKNFTSPKQQEQYIYFLKKEMAAIESQQIDSNAIKLYQLKTQYPESKIAARCLDFKQLEQKCLEYKQNRAISDDRKVSDEQSIVPQSPIVSKSLKR